MMITPLDRQLTAGVRDLMLLGDPYVQARTPSDYWLYAELFSNTCPVALAGDDIIGAIIAFRSQTAPGEIYVQDVMTHPRHRRKGVTKVLLGCLVQQAQAWSCKRLYLTSEPSNRAAHGTWLTLGFTNAGGDITIDGVSVVKNFKGPGKDRAVYELMLPDASTGEVAVSR